MLSWKCTYMSPAGNVSFVKIYSYSNGNVNVAIKYPHN